MIRAGFELGAGVQVTDLSGDTLKSHIENTLSKRNQLRMQGLTFHAVTYEIQVFWNSGDWEGNFRRGRFLTALLGRSTESRSLLLLHAEGRKRKGTILIVHVNIQKVRSLFWPPRRWCWGGRIYLLKRTSLWKWMASDLLIVSVKMTILW